MSENVGENRRLSEVVIDFGEVRQTPGLAVVILGVPGAHSFSVIFKFVNEYPGLCRVSSFDFVNDRRPDPIKVHFYINTPDRCCCCFW
jgi:hypothetical protein